MNIDEVIGYYTYRSFLDRPIGAPNDILWGEGELFLLINDEGIIAGTLAFPADAGSEQKDFMDLSGTVSMWEGPSLRFIGKGRSGSAIAEYEYEYDCRIAHEWDTANPRQRVTLTGTVRRNKDHGQAKAGATASFIAVQRDFVEPRSILGVALIPEAITMLSGRVHRLRHTVWHTLRGDWQSDKMTAADRDRLKLLGWHLADPPLRSSGGLDLTNGAGEDFLYMHRRMILMLHQVYDRAGKSRPTSWKELPPANSPQFAYREVQDSNNPAIKTFVYAPENSGVMVPPPTIEFLGQVGANPFFRFNKTSRGLANLMQTMAASLRNPRVASQLTLGAYGNLIEFTVHNWMHMRWATLSRNPKSASSEVRGDYEIDPKWDAPINDYLGDFHSSHVNPIFWKLHGWVDDCIGAWQDAHATAHPGQVHTREVRGIPWFAPGPWVLKNDPFDWPGAGEAHDHEGSHPDHGGGEQKVLEEVIAILKEINDRPVVSRAFAKHAQARLPGFARFSIFDAGD